MDISDLLDPKKQAKLDKEIETLRQAKIAEKETRIRKKEVKKEEKTGGLSNFDKLNQMGHQITSLDFGGTEIQREWNDYEE